MNIESSTEWEYLGMIAAAAVLAAIVSAVLVPAWADTGHTGTPPTHHLRHVHKPHAHRPGPAGQRVIHGKASYYSPRLAGRPMSNGKPLDLNSDSAASKTLPLGSTAKVTNLKNGQSTTVRIEDRGPVPAGRVIDVTPKVADRLGMRKDGVEQVKVEPLAEDASTGHAH